MKWPRRLMTIEMQTWTKSPLSRDLNCCTRLIIHWEKLACKRSFFTRMDVNIFTIGSLKCRIRHIQIKRSFTQSYNALTDYQLDKIISRIVLTLSKHSKYTNKVLDLDTKIVRSLLETYSTNGSETKMISKQIMIKMDSLIKAGSNFKNSWTKRGKLRI